MIITGLCEQQPKTTVVTARGVCPTPGQATSDRHADRHLASTLLGLDGVEVIDVEPGGGATRVAHVITAGDVPRVCPRCGVPSRRGEGNGVHHTAGCAGGPDQAGVAVAQAALVV